MNKKILAFSLIFLILTFSFIAKPAAAIPVVPLLAASTILITIAFLATHMYYANYIANNVPENPGVDIKSYINDVSLAYAEGADIWARTTINTVQLANYTYGYYARWACALIASAWSSGNVTQADIPEIIAPVRDDDRLPLASIW